MILFIIIQAYLIAGTLFSSGHDAMTYRLKGSDNSLTKSRLNRWHRDGVVINILFLLPCIYICMKQWYFIIIASVFIRLAFFDLGFNKYATLNLSYIGFTSWWDNFMRKIFGIQGAIIKSIIFFILLCVLNFLYYEFT